MLALRYIRGRLQSLEYYIGEKHTSTLNFNLLDNPSTLLTTNSYIVHVLIK